MIKHCTNCLMPSSRPRMIMMDDGRCPACHWNDERKEINYEPRKKDFLALVEKYKKHPVYDCIVPFSGGKDSAAIALRLRSLGLRPLLVTYGQLLWTDVGQRNFDRVCGAGFDIFYWRVDQRVSRHLARRFFIERGHPKQHYDAGVNSVPVRTAKQFGIPLIIYAEHGESEYGGLVLSEEHRRKRDLAEVLENQVGDDARNWASDGLTDGDVWPYTYPENVDGIEAVYFSHYFPWDIYENAKFCRDEIGFEQAHSWTRLTNADPIVPVWWGKSDGSFEGFDSIDDKIDDLDFYMMQIKFGFGRATRMASRLIQKGHLTREQGLELARRYDGEFPRTYLDDVQEYINMSRDEIMTVIDKHRNHEIWEARIGDEWKLRCPPK